MKSKHPYSMFSIIFFSCFLLAAAQTAQPTSEDIQGIVQSGDLARLQALVESDPGCLTYRDDEGQTLLHIAAEAGRLDIARWLIARGADVESKNTYGQTPFMAVARNTGDVAMGRLLVQHGANINAGDKNAYLPLNWSAFFNYKEFIEFLLSQGADFDAGGGKDTQMLMFAARAGSLRLFQLVAEKGKDIFANGPFNTEVMRGAVAGGSLEIVNLLLAKGIPLKDEGNINGWTPLHLAGKNGHAAMVEFLVKNGANLNRRTLSGKSAYNIAAEAKRNDMLSLIVKLGGSTAPQQFPVLKGPYLGQTPPAGEAKIFAPDIVSANHSSITFAPDGKEIYWQSSTDRVIWMTKMQDGQWSLPEAVPFSLAVKGNHIDDVPCITPDGKRMFFTSTRPIGADASGKENIWVADRTAAGWSEPNPLNAEVNEMSLHWQVSVANSGTLYFAARAEDSYAGNSDIYYAKLVNGKYAKPVNLGPVVNSSALEGMPFIAADESYLLFGRQTVTGGKADNGFCISFKGKDGQWLAPISLQPYAGQGVCPSIHPDGKYFFYLGGEGGAAIRWLDAAFIRELQPKR